MGFPNYYYAETAKLLVETLGSKISAVRVERHEYSIEVTGNINEGKRKIPFRMFLNWRNDGTETKPVTTIYMDMIATSYGRFAFWDDYRETVEDLATQRLQEQFQAVLEDA